MNVPTSLYRHFAADGSLLYVGISLSWPARTRAHSHQSSWFNEIVRVEIEWFASREEAMAAEREAIQRERPRFNVIHNRPPVSKPRVISQPRKVQPAIRDPLLQMVRGPCAIVGPALIYQRDTISMMVVHGEVGTVGELTELILGDHFPEIPSWAEVCASVLTLRRGNEITLSEARDARLEIIRKLERNLRNVQAFDTDLALAVAYASQFPSDKSRQILDEIAIERRVAA